MSEKNKHVSTFKAIGHPVRNDILNLLREGPLTAGAISENFDLSQATISHHLTLLKKAGLIRERKEKNYVIYELNTSVFEDTLRWLKTFI